MPLAAIQGAKFELRRSALAQRNDVAAKRGPQAAQALAKQIQAILPDPEGILIAGYWPLGSELDCRPSLQELCARGGGLCLPVAGQRGDRLIFRQWAPDGQLENGPFGTSHPPPSAPAVEPTIILVPLLAFDGQCHRLGYGAGFYDRTLTLMRRERAITAIGIAFAEQQVAAVPVEPTDAALDVVLTDQGLLYPATPQKERL